MAWQFCLSSKTKMMLSKRNNLETQRCQANQPIGVFDSGIGGLSVANAIAHLLPYESLHYFGDTANLPYGTKPLQTIRAFSHNISEFLIDEKKVKAVVVACNTASAAAIDYLRATWPDIPFIGMEPAVKPGASRTTSGKVGVLATQGTFSSDRYFSLTQRFAEHVEVWEDPCIGLVELIEAGKVNDPVTRSLLNKVLEPMLEANVDTFVLGCTHYPFVEQLIQDIVGRSKLIINPAPAVARQLKKVLTNHGLLVPPNGQAPNHEFSTSGEEAAFQTAVQRFFRNATLPI